MEAVEGWRGLEWMSMGREMAGRVGGIYAGENEHCLVVIVCSCGDVDLDEGGASKSTTSVGMRSPSSCLKVKPG